MALLWFPSLGAAEPTACPATQRTLFACVTGGKLVAVCGSATLTATSGSVQYRFGRPDKVELSYPASGAEWRPVTRGGSLLLSGGGGAFVSFARVPYRYIVYTASGSGWGQKAGVVVEKNGQRLANLACHGTVTSELGPDLFSSAGIELADESFDLR